MPHDLDAERALLGGLMIDPKAIYRVGNIVDAEDFYVDAHRILYRTIHRLSQSGTPTDIVILSGYLQAENNLDRVGGSVMLAELISCVPTAANISHYGMIVREKSTSRKYLLAAMKFVKSGGSQDSRDLFLGDLTQIDSSKQEQGMTLGDSLEAAVELILLENTGEYPGISLGPRLTKLSRLLRGLEMKDRWIIAALTGYGKTAIALQMLRHIVKCVPATFYSLETSKPLIFRRMVLQESRNNLPHEITKAANTLYSELKDRLFVEDTITGEREIELSMRHYMHTKNVKVFGVDYLHIVRPSSTSKTSNRAREIGSIMATFCDVVQTTDTALIALCQLNRSSEKENRRPVLADIRDSGEIAEMATKVLMFYAEKDKVTGRYGNPRELIAAKNKDGDGGAVAATFDGPFYTYTETDYRRGE